MFNIFTPSKEATALNSPVLETEGLHEQAHRQEPEQLKQLERQESEAIQESLNQLATKDLDHQAIVKLNLLDTLDFITDKITKLQEPTVYLQARTEFLQTLKICQKRLERHEENTFIPMLEAKQTDNLKLGKWEVTFRPSKKTVIDEDRLKIALPNPEQLKLFLKPPEFKTLPECRRLLLNLNIFCDVYTVKQGKKPILNIIDTNTIKREIESQGQEIEEDEPTAENQTQELATNN